MPETHVSTSLRGKGRRGGRGKGGRRRGRERRKGKRKGRERREGRKGKGGGRRGVTVSHEQTHTHTLVSRQTHFPKKREGSGELCI